MRSLGEQVIKRGIFIYFIRGIIVKTIIYKATYITSIDLEDIDNIDENMAWELFWDNIGPCAIYPKDFDEITFEVIED